MCVGKERVRKLIQLHGIRAKGERRFQVTTDSKLRLAGGVQPAGSAV